MPHPQKIKMRCRIFLERILALEWLRQNISELSWRKEGERAGLLQDFPISNYFWVFLLVCPIIKIMQLKDHHRSRSKRAVATGYWVSGLVGHSRAQLGRSKLSSAHVKEGAAHMRKVFTHFLALPGIGKCLPEFASESTRDLSLSPTSSPYQVQVLSLERWYLYSIR